MPSFGDDSTMITKLMQLIVSSVWPLIAATKIALVANQRTDVECNYEHVHLYRTLIPSSILKCPQKVTVFAHYRVIFV